MKYVVNRARWLLGSLSLAAAFSCSDRANDCEWLSTCTTDAGRGGVGGGSSGGEGGRTNGGHSGSAGESGMGDGGRGAEAGAGGEGGASGAGGEGGTPSACDTSKSPSVEACIATDAHAVFVAPTGSDSADGSRAMPLKSIAKALALAETTSKVVIACNGKFDEHLNVTAGARLYGGFACPGEKVPWTYHPGKRAQVVPSDEGTALEIRNVADAVTIEDVEFYSRDATTPGGSSIAAIIESSDDVRLARVRIVAGAAMAGADGESGTKGIDGAELSGPQEGTRASCGDGAPDEQFGGKWQKDSVCGSRGGPGGPSQKGVDGSPGSPGNPRTNVVGSQSPDDLENGGDKGPEGGDGKPGAPGLSGALGQPASEDGSFTALGFTPAAGGAGSDGFPGQGGGGGGASNATGVCIGASGGAGGMGGCGGKGGTGGLGGGASVALIAWSSALTLDACELVAQEGGAGGKGGDGGLGGLGKEGAVGGAAFSDASNSIGKGGNGGPGGNGGVGGPGAGGNGGPSIALVFHGVAPDGVASSVLTPGSAGAAGPGGSAGALVGEDGKAGTASAQLSVP